MKEKNRGLNRAIRKLKNEIHQNLVSSGQCQMDTPTARHVFSIWPKPFSESVLKSATISKPQNPTFIATFRTTIHRNEFPFLFELERFMNERAIFLLFDRNLQPSCWRDTENIRRSRMSFGVQQNILMRFLIRFLKRFTKSSLLLCKPIAFKEPPEPNGYLDGVSQ